MKKMIPMLLVLAAASSAMNAQASDRKGMMPIAAAMATEDAQKLDPSIKYYFGSQKTPRIADKLGTEKTSLKTNGFGKSDEVACNHVFASAMLRLEAHAKKVGANAVTNIVSNYGNIENASETEFECHNGGLMAGVAFKADFVRLAK